MAALEVTLVALPTNIIVKVPEPEKVFVVDPFNLGQMLNHLNDAEKEIYYTFLSKQTMVMENNRRTGSVAFLQLWNYFNAMEGK